MTSKVLKTPVYNQRTVTIANGATVSSATNIAGPGAGATVVAVIIPPAFTGTAMTFQVSNDNVTYRALNNLTAPISLTVAADKHIGLTRDAQDAFAGAGWVKVVSGTAEGAARNVTLLVRKVR